MIDPKVKDEKSKLEDYYSRAILRETILISTLTCVISLNRSLNKSEGFLNMLQLRKPRHASLFILIMEKESDNSLVLMIYRKAIKECGKKE